MQPEMQGCCGCRSVRQAARVGEGSDPTPLLPGGQLEALACCVIHARQQVPEVSATALPE